MDDESKSGQKRKLECLETKDVKSDTRPAKIYYDVTQEVMSKSMKLDSNFIKLGEGFDKICHRFSNALKDPSNDNSSIKRFVDDITSRILERKADKTIMSVNGPMGSGKSETINTILHETIAVTGKTGRSVTLVPHKYSGPVDGQEKYFRAEVEFFIAEERTRFLRGELAAFYRAETSQEANPGDDFEDTEGPEDIDTRDTVVEALHSLFSDHDECNSRKATREFLKSAKSEDDDKIARRLTGWADAAINKHTNGQSRVVIETDTAAKLLERLAAYASDGTDDDDDDDDDPSTVSLWPLVRGVYIHFENPLSKMGVALVDVPGSSDNHIRRSIARKVVHKCSHAAVTVQASRASSGSVVLEGIKAVKSKGEGNILVFVTCSDEIDDDTFVGGTSRQKEDVKNLQDQISSLKKQLNATKLEIRHARGTPQEIDLGDRFDLEEKAINNKIGEETALRIVIRGMKTRQTIQRKLRDVTGFVDDVPVLWLSNLAYRRHKAGHYPDDAPVLTVEETNGPTARRMISEFPNKTNLKQVKYIYGVQLPMLLSRVQLFSTRAPADLKADIEGHVRSPIERFPAMMEAAWTKMTTSIVNTVLGPLKDLEALWNTKAGSLCDDWAQRFKCSQAMLSLMNNEGYRKKRGKKEEVNMTGDLQKISSKSFDTCFAQLVPATNELQTAIISDIEHLCQGVIDGIKSDPSGQLMKLEAFYKTIRLQQQDSRDQIKDWIGDVVDDLNDIKQKLLIDDEEAYMVRKMHPIYQKVRVIKCGQGRKASPCGFPQMRHKVFKVEITKQGSVWAGVCAAAERDLNILHKRHKKRLMALVSSAFTNICSAFDDIKTSESDDAAAERQRALLADCLREAEKCMGGEMKVAYERLKLNFPESS